MTDDRRSHECWFLLVLLAGGLVLRIIWIARVHGGPDVFLDAAEATRVALAIARGDGIADAYFIGQGPTAHLMPFSPAMAGGILWLLGPGTSAANLTLFGWSLAQVVIAWLLLRALFGRLGADPAAIRWGVAILCLVPAFAPQETVDFQFWEGATALALAAANLLLMIPFEDGRQPRARDIAAIGALSAATTFVSPPVGLATAMCWAFVALRRWPFLRSVQLAATAATMLAIALTPWVLRNHRLLGSPVVTRSNAGLELALANHPRALSGIAPERVFHDRILAIQPAANPALHRGVTAPGGEVRYAAMRGQEARRWIASNPIAFARLYLRHLRQFFLPSPWQMYFSGWSEARVARSIAITTVHLLGLLGLVLGLNSGRRRYGLIAVYLAAIALPYAAFQPTVRYIYLIWGPLAFLAADAVLRIGGYLRGPGTAR